MAGTFAVEIRQDIFARQEMVNFDKQAQKIVTATFENIKEFVINRVTLAPRGNEYVPKKVKETAQFLTEEGTAATGSCVESYIAKLCNALAWRIHDECPSYFGLLRNGPEDEDLKRKFGRFGLVHRRGGFVDRFYRAANVYDKLAVAAIANDATLFQCLLSSLQSQPTNKEWGRGYSLLWGSPEGIAAYYGHDKILQELISYTEALPQDERTGSWILRDLGQAMLHAIKRNSRDTMALIVNLYSLTKKKAPSELFGRWMGLAVETHDVETCQLLLDVETENDPFNDLLLDTFAQICKLGNAQLVRNLSAKGILHPRKYLFKGGGTGIIGYPLDVAICHGNYDMVVALLDEGANADGHIGDRVSYKEYECPPLHRAIEKGDLRLVKLFIERGARVRTSKRWQFDSLKLAVRTLDKDLYEYIRQKVMSSLNGGKAPPTFEVARRRCRV
jgi:hypothetical protein